MKPNAATLQSWNQLAQAYQDKFMEMDLYNNTYDRFCELITKDNAKVLELGCGPGNITKYIRKQKPNYSILATDTAQSMIELGKVNVPKAEFQLLDVRDIVALNQTFDGIIGGFVIPYLTPNETKQFINDSFNLLNDNGVLYFSCIEKEKNYSEAQTSSDGKVTMEVNYYETAFLLELLDKKRYNLISIFRIEYPKLGETTDVHLVIIAQKKK